ncbi:uncharacterized protein TNCT_415801 [Trichonephila clavata]|uniref:Uncharacterized protein n=1 Tax=Trichonephila clavata TaxID=2740835 RepID=A0A8X6HPK5_TRICU|nr:uncharacterized protein TNCT_415801 [Trichonephila clavata]
MNHVPLYSNLARHQIGRYLQAKYRFVLCDEFDSKGGRDRVSIRKFCKIWPVGKNGQGENSGSVGSRGDVDKHAYPGKSRSAKVILRYIHKQDGIESILAQDFVQNERLNRLIQNVVKSGQSNTISTLLAIDGLIGPKLNNGPQFEYKKYLENLKYSSSGEQGRYDREDDDLVKRTHVFAIRKVYKEVKNLQSDENVDSKLMHCVYQVMSSMLKESAGLELPKGPGIPLPDNVMKACSDVYWSNTSWEYFNRLVEILKSKIVVSTNNADSLTSNVEDGSAKKRKKEEQHEIFFFQFKVTWKTLVHQSR